MTELYHLCPRFVSCEVNKCPLDEDYHERNKLKGEKRCNMRKSVRLRIAKQFPQVKLPFEGYTGGELSGHRLVAKGAMSRECV